MTYRPGLISTIELNIDMLSERSVARQFPVAGSVTDPEEWRVSSSDAAMTTAGTAESVGGGEAVGMPSLRQAAKIGRAHV